MLSLWRGFWERDPEKEMVGVGEKVGLDSTESSSCSRKCPVRTGRQGSVEWEPPFPPGVGPVCSGPCCSEGLGGAGGQEQAGPAEPWGQSGASLR